MLTSPDDVLARRAVRRLGSSLCGRYTLRHVIGIGGMGAVYAGVHRNGHAVAIKILHERLASDPEIERLFRREAQLANKIDHPGVVPVIDDDVTDDGCVFLVMPLLEGETIRARAERLGRTLSVSEVIIIADAVLGVLSSAHQKRIVHRDIKPENIFVTRGGDLRVLDFGIGRFFETNDASASATRSGRALGTPAFMAPEQARGRHRDVDGRTDIWALGATMFTLLSGRFVHEAESPTELAIAAATKAAPPLESVAPAVPETVRQLVDRALAFNREERWIDAGTMAHALLEASTSAFGLQPTELPRLSVPAQAIAHDFESIPTRAPQSAESDSDRGTPGPSIATRTARLEPALHPTAAGFALSPNARRPTRFGDLLRTRPVLLLSLISLPLVAFLLMLSLRSPPLRTTANTQSPGGDLLAISNRRDLPPEAVNEFLTGARLWRDASSTDSVSRFASAAKIAPDFAAAHLWYVLAAWGVTSTMRDHYASALHERTSLTDLQLAVLNALQPVIQDPPDRVAAAKQLASLVHEHPTNPELSILLATYYERMGDRTHGLPVIDKALSLPNPAPVAAYIRARLLSLTSALDTSAEPVRLSLEHCVQASPGGTDCLYDLARVDANEGYCTALESLARTELARQPNSWLAYSDMANGLASTGHSNGSVRAALEEQWRRIENDDLRRDVQAQDNIDFAVYSGDLILALRLAMEYKFVQGKSGQPQPEPYEEIVFLASELGEIELSRSVYQEFADVSETWPRIENTDPLARVFYVGSASGYVDTRGRLVFRERILAEAEDPAYGAPYRRWLNGYAVGAVTPEEANEALANMPPEPLPGPPYRDAQDDYTIGRIFLLAQKVDKAQAFFSRAAHSCSLSDDFFRTKAQLELARLQESSDPHGACSAYAAILVHWKDSPTSKTVRAALENSKKLSCLLK